MVIGRPAAVAPPEPTLTDWPSVGVVITTRNRPHLGEWEDAVEVSRLPAADVEHLTPSQRAGELAMLMLRLERGIVLNDFSARTGLDALSRFAATIDRLEQLGLITAAPDAIRLTASGLNVADAVSADFLSAADSE